MIDIESSKPIAVGRTAEIYQWDKAHVLKLFFPNFPAAEAQQEAECIRVVQAAGVQTAMATDLIEISGRYGIVLEKLEGKSLFVHLEDNLSQAAAFAQKLAQIHGNIHQHQSDQLPEMGAWLIPRIRRGDRLRDSVKDEIIERLNRLPTGNTVCHGDFHLDNVLQTADGPVVIDWCNAFRGHPLADVARTSLMLTTGGAPPHLNQDQLSELLALRHLFNEAYLDHYLVSQSFTREDLDPWFLPVAAARLIELAPDEQQPVLDVIEQKL